MPTRFAIALPMILAAAAVQAPARAQMPAMPPAAPMAGGGQAEMLHMMVMGARNQLGVLEFCQSKGFVGADTVALQQKMLGMLPPTTPDGLDAAETTGKAGTVSFGGSQTSLDEAATKQGTTVEALCGKLASALAQAAKAMPQ